MSTDLSKQDLVDRLAESQEMPKAAAGRFVDALFDVVVSTCAAEGSVNITGFGKWSAKKRNAREGRNPQTGATIQIPEAMVPSFKAGKGFKDAVNKS